MAPSRGVKSKPKKGVNPLKAAALAARQSGNPLHLTLHNDDGGSPFPSSSSSSSSTSDLSTLISHQNSPPLLTLLFSDAATQHRALSRLEAFYEDAKRGRKYLTLQEAKGERLCANYEAFNLPISVVGEWLEEMRKREVGQGPLMDYVVDVEPACDEAQEDGNEGLDELIGATQSLNMSNGSPSPVSGARKREYMALTEPSTSTACPSSPWWTPFCNREELYILDLLQSLSALSPSHAQPEPSQSSPASTSSSQATAVDSTTSPTPSAASSPPPIYLISTLSTSKSNLSLSHERLHALYHLSSVYRSVVKTLYHSIPPKLLSIIEHDLSLRGYSEKVWQDEFQAYASLDPNEFGNRTALECQRVQGELRRAQREMAREVGLQDLL